jgi:hypothetical protein
VYREIIAEVLTRGGNAVAIWQDLVDGHGFPARYASVHRFVGNCAAAARLTRAASSRPRLRLGARSTAAAMGRWCATRSPSGTGGCASSC